jgi:hypothetical protein
MHFGGKGTVLHEAYPLARKVGQSTPFPRALHPAVIHVEAKITVFKFAVLFIQDGVEPVLKCSLQCLKRAARSGRPRKSFMRLASMAEKRS